MTIHGTDPSMWRLPSILAIALLAGAAGSASAQAPFGTEPRSFLAAAGLAALPVGDFDDHADTGYGIGAAFLYVPEGHGWLGARLDVGYINYGNDTVGDCPDTPFQCPDRVARSVKNDILYAGIGPQAMLPYGPVRPYAAVSAGIAYFASSFSEETGADTGQFNSESLADDPAFRVSAGAGLYIMLPTHFPIAIDVGARYHRNGEVEYVPELELDPDASGPPDVSTIVGDADYLTLQIGLTVGIPGRKRL